MYVLVHVWVEGASVCNISNLLSLHRKGTQKSGCYIHFEVPQIHWWCSVTLLVASAWMIVFTIIPALGGYSMWVHLHTSPRLLSGPQAHHAHITVGSFFSLPSAICTFSAFTVLTLIPESHCLVQSLSLIRRWYLSYNILCLSHCAFSYLAEG